MAIAEEGHTYAQIFKGKVHWIFNKSTLPEWNNEHCPAVDITGMSPMPEAEWTYDGENFFPPVLDIPAAWQRLRELRDMLIAKTDWTQLPDAVSVMSEEKKTQWAVYRQALRDLPANVVDPFNYSLPTEPGK